MVFNISYNALMFEHLLKQLLIKEPKPNQLMITDNASFHKSEKK